MSYIDELEARFPTKGVTFICEVQAMRHGEACATVDCLRVSIAASQDEAEKAKAKQHAIDLAVDGYVDGAPDCNAVSKLANQVSLIINPPEFP